MSGEMNTSLGNGFSNLMFMLYACHTQGIACDGIVEGDDGVFRLERELDPKIFTEMGLTIKLQKHEEISAMSFCGIICDQDARQQVTDPRKILARFGWCPLRYVGCGKRMKNMLNVCKALSYSHAYPHLPVVRKFCDYILRTSQRKVYTYDYARRLNSYEKETFLKAAEAHAQDRVPAFLPDMRTRMLVEREFGITVQQQLAAEKYLDSLRTLGPVHFDFDFPKPYYRSWEMYVNRYPDQVVDQQELLNVL